MFVHVFLYVLMIMHVFNTCLIALRGDIGHNEGRRADKVYGRGPLLRCLCCRVLNSEKGKEKKGGEEGRR